jgi:hypothetical protein
MTKLEEGGGAASTAEEGLQIELEKERQCVRLFKED